MPREDLLGLRWRAHLEALLADGREWEPVATDGARIAAQRLLDLLEAAAATGRAPAKCAAIG